MLRKFQDFGFNMNGACDAEVDSYDAMVLFTGRADDLRDVGPRKTTIQERVHSEMNIP